MALFSQPTVFDGRPIDAFATSNPREGPRYVSQLLSQTFGAFESSKTPLEVPDARVWWHATGVVFLLKAVLGQRLSGTPLVTILVEERQMPALKHKTAGQLGLSLNSVRIYIKQIGLKGLAISDGA